MRCVIRCGTLKPALEDYRKCKLDTSCTMVPPNKIYEGRIHANVLNMTAGQDAEIGPFPPKAVKQEFNADTEARLFLHLIAALPKI